MDKQQILAAFANRHATKRFDETKKISDDDFTYILETARLSPSSFGYEPWRFVVVQDEQLKAKLAPVTWGQKGSCRRRVISCSFSLAKPICATIRPTLRT